LKEDNINKQNALIDLIENRAKEHHLNHVKSPELRAELEEIIQSFYAKKYLSMYAS
jgi:hypothetical protein